MASVDSWLSLKVHPSLLSSNFVRWSASGSRCYVEASAFDLQLSSMISLEK